MGVQIAALGLVFGALFRAQLHEFLPFICVSLIFWGFISACLTEGCTSFIAAEGIILQVRMPLFAHVLRCHHRNAIILAHNLLILPLAFLLVGRIPSWHALLAIPGLLAIAINVLWMMLIFAVACTRYRDLTQIVQNAVQVLFYITPLMWMPRTLPEGDTNFCSILTPSFI